MLLLRCSRAALEHALHSCSNAMRTRRCCACAPAVPVPQPPAAAVGRCHLLSAGRPHTFSIGIGNQCLICLPPPPGSGAATTGSGEAHGGHPCTATRYDWALLHHDQEPRAPTARVGMSGGAPGGLLTTSAFVAPCSSAQRHNPPHWHTHIGTEALTRMHVNTHTLCSRGHPPSLSPE